MKLLALLVSLIVSIRISFHEDVFQSKLSSLVEHTGTNATVSTKTSVFLNPLLKRNSHFKRRSVNMLYYRIFLCIQRDFMLSAPFGNHKEIDVNDKAAAQQAKTNLKPRIEGDPIET